MDENEVSFNWNTIVCEILHKTYMKHFQLPHILIIKYHKEINNIFCTLT